MASGGPVAARPVGPRALMLALAGVVQLVAGPLRAQDLGWSGTAEASANLLHGAVRGRVASAALGLGRADSVLQVRAELQVTYADSRDADDNSAVNARATRATLAVDRQPFARVSPFAFGSAETSLQQRIASRFAGGAGAKLVVHRHGDDDASVSLALLGERTRALDPAPAMESVSTRVRWSLRGKLRRRFSDALRFTHVTFYQPAVDRPARYTIDSNSSLAATMTRSLALTATLRERFDSEARTRGARSNHDGQLLFGVRTSF